MVRIRTEKRKEYERKYKREHKKEVQAWAKKYHQKNRKHRNEYAKKYREEHKEYFKNKYHKWVKRNPQRVKEFYDRWIKANPEKVYCQGLRREARKRNIKGSHTFGEWELLKKQYGFTCPACGRKEPEIKLTEDHIIPITKGGSGYIENIQPLCVSCNSKKHTQTIKYQIRRNNEDCKG